MEKINRQLECYFVEDEPAVFAKLAQVDPATMLLWLDFDRADLAPDDAVSVLESLVSQAAVQADDFAAATVDEMAWEAAADRFGADLANTYLRERPPLLVLDGFEIAQWSERYEEIWFLLGRVLQWAPELRIVVSGRAPVGDVTLAGRPARVTRLTGLPPEAARAWLVERGIAAPAVLDVVLRLAQGIPLLLKLAVMLIETGGEVGDLPDRLPKEIVNGYLYQRILDRIVDQRIRPLVQDALVLRRVTAGMMGTVFPEHVKPARPAAELFAQLSRELAVVDELDAASALAGTTPMRLRPEVRAATLRLLEVAEPGRVRAIDERAAAWYATQDRDAPEVAAELAYHRLRLGDVAGAQAAWRVELGPLLANAVDDLPEGAAEARRWLEQRLTTAGAAAVTLETWEFDALTRIRDALGRRLLRLLPPILAEREGRSVGSALTVYDAWSRWTLHGDLLDARSLLDRAGPASASVRRDRGLLAARLALLDKDPVTANAHLAGLDDPEAWTDRPNARTERLAVYAARLRLNVDLEAELALSDRLRNESDTTLLLALRTLLGPGDVLLPSLSEQFPRPGGKHGRAAPEVPHTTEAITGFAATIDLEREDLRAEPSMSTPLTSLSPQAILDMPELLGPGAQVAVELARRLAELARRRWASVTTTLFLADAEELLMRSTVVDAMTFAVVGTPAPFRGQPLRFRTGDVIDLTLRAANSTTKDLPVSAPDSLAERVIRREARHGWRDPSSWRDLPADGWFDGVNSLVVYLLGPDPLETLLDAVLDLPGRPV